MHTKDKLAMALLKAGAPESMVKKAEIGYYDDYLSPLATPIVQLVSDCRFFIKHGRPGLKDIVKRAKNGEFDATKEESEAWAGSAEGKETFARLMEGAKNANKK